MLFKHIGLVAAALFNLKLVSADDLPAIEIVGNKFFYSNNGSQFYIRGIAYQQDTANVTSGETFVDPLSDADICARDIPYLSAVGTNTIRVYALNDTLDHTSCMTQLADAGIYVIADLSEPSESIDRSDPSWTVELYNRYTTIVDEFHNYTNILGFFAGNEVSNDNTNTDASAFVKAAIRDTKQYISDQGYRTIPVGYSSNDDSKTRVSMADYFACGDEDERADFYGINMYEWCGDSTFEESGYADRTAEFANLSIPAFFSEYGCNEVTPREFTEVAALYSDNMTDVWSGGIVYMYFEEDNNYGLVSIESGKVSTLDDYNNYKTEILAISPTSAVSSDVTTASTELSCPTQNSNWKAATALPPTPDDALCTCLQDSLACVISDDVDSDSYADLFSYVCGLDDGAYCDGVTANGTTGTYGAYSFCSAKQKLSFALNLYYEEQGSVSSACDFSGSASIKTASTASACSSALSAAGSSGVGTVSGTISGVSASGTATGSTTKSGSGSSGSSGSATASSSSTSTSKSSAANVRAPNVSYLFASVLSLVAVGGVSLLMI